MLSNITLSLCMQTETKPSGTFLLKCNLCAPETCSRHMPFGVYMDFLKVGWERNEIS